MHIAEVARRTGFSKDTIRWYEKIGLIVLEPNERDENNYRNYSAQTLERLMLIKGVKSFGFTLKEIKVLMNLDDEGQLNCDPVSEMVDTKVEVINRQIQKLQAIRHKLTRGRDHCAGECKAMFVT